MAKPLTIVMYHYVRDLEHSRFPDIKGLTIQQFRGQVEYMQRFYTFVTVEQVLASLMNDGGDLPRNAAMLTFDDGYIDHFTNVFPILYEKGIQGCFFPIGKAVSDHRVLDVNKIHFVLASASDKMDLVRQIWSLLDELRSTDALESNEYYYRKYAIATRYDPPEVGFIKKLLQRGLPEGSRTKLTDELFRKYVDLDEAAFARELYMNADQIKCMSKAGMYISSHGYQHRWLDTVSTETQKTEIKTSLQFLDELGCDLQKWSFTYPHGAHNESLVSLLRAAGAKFGLTAEVGIADLDSEDILLLSRLNTNDLPKEGNAGANEWTQKVI